MSTTFKRQQQLLQLGRLLVLFSREEIGNFQSLLNTIDLDDAIAEITAARDMDLFPRAVTAPVDIKYIANMFVEMSDDDDMSPEDRDTATAEFIGAFQSEQAMSAILANVDPGEVYKMLRPHIKKLRVVLTGFGIAKGITPPPAWFPDVPAIVYLASGLYIRMIQEGRPALPAIAIPSPTKGFTEPLP